MDQQTTRVYFRMYICTSWSTKAGILRSLGKQSDADSIGECSKDWAAADTSHKRCPWNEKRLVVTKWPLNGARYWLNARPYIRSSGTLLLLDSRKSCPSTILNSQIGEDCAMGSGFVPVFSVSGASSNRSGFDVIRWTCAFCSCRFRKQSSNSANWSLQYCNSSFKELSNSESVDCRSMNSTHLYLNLLHLKQVDESSFRSHLRRCLLQSCRLWGNIKWWQKERLPTLT